MLAADWEQSRFCRSSTILSADGSRCLLFPSPKLISATPQLLMTHQHTLASVVPATSFNGDLCAKSSEDNVGSLAPRAAALVLTISTGRYSSLGFVQAVPSSEQVHRLEASSLKRLARHPFALLRSLYSWWVQGGPRPDEILAVRKILGFGA